MSGEITNILSEPFSELSDAISSPVSPSVIALEGRIYLVNTASDEWDRQGVDVLKQRNTDDNRDLLLLPQDVWRQQAQSWHQGAGQTNLDREDALRHRYDYSFGINPWTRWQMSLLPSTAALASTPTADKKMFLQVHNGSLVIGCDTTLHWYSDETTVVTKVPVAADEIIDMTYDGDSIITLHASGKVYKSTDNATSTLFGTWSGATFISYAKDYLIAGVANVLKNITAGGAGTTIYTSPVTGFRWLGACEGLTEIYLLGGAGDRYVVHRIRVKDDGTGLEPCVVAATLPDGETGYSIGSYLGFVFIGTSKGVRMGVVASNTYVTAGNLTLGAIIPTDAPVYCFEGQDRFVWYGQSSINCDFVSTGTENSYFPAGPVPGLGRLDLQTFTITDATPAYANDLVALDQTSKTVTAVVTWNDKRVFAVRNGGVYMEQDELMEAGWLTQGLMSFSVEDDKTGLYMQAKWLPLEGEISLDLAYDSTEYIRMTNLTIQSSIKSENITLNGAQFSRLSVRYVLRRDSDDSTLGPTLTRWEMRAVPANGQASRWTIPILLRESVDIGGSTGSRNVQTDYNHLISLWESRRLFSLQENGQSYQVQAKKFRWHPEELTENGQAWQGEFTIVVEEIK